MTSSFFTRPNTLANTSISEVLWAASRSAWRAYSSNPDGTTWRAPLTAPRNPLALGMLAPKVRFHVSENRSKPSMPINSNRASTRTTTALTTSRVVSLNQ